MKLMALFKLPSSPSPLPFFARSLGWNKNLLTGYEALDGWKRISNPLRWQIRRLEKRGNRAQLVKSG
jgi:hypothetical protein